jgi:hypothetical protein
VVTPHLGELTPFANALAELGARGCHVHIAVEDDPPPGTDISVFAGRFRRLTVGPAPRVQASTALGRAIRAAIDAQGARSAPVLAAIDRLMPPPAAIVDFLGAFNPELLVVTSLFSPGSTAPDYLRAAQLVKVATFGMPVRWDDLTSGARLHVVPDCVALWNREDRRLAIERCGVQARRTAVIGVPLPFDILGAIKTTREKFCERLGLDPARAVIVFVPRGSDDERRAAFAEWVGGVRSSTDRRVREAQVLVHWPPPGGVRQRTHPEISEAVVLPLEDSDATWYRFDVAEALHHADAVVVTDMTLVLEAAARTRPVLPLLWLGEDAELSRFCAESSLRGEWLMPSATAKEHVAQLTRVLDSGLAAGGRMAIRYLVRPHGPDLSPGFLMAARLFQEIVDRRADTPRPRGLWLRRVLLSPIAGLAAWHLAARPAPGPAGGAARILVGVPGAEALYLHQPLLCLLAERGHRLQILFTARRSQTADVYTRIRCDIPGVSTAGTLVPADGVWPALSRGLLGVSAFAGVVEGRHVKPSRWHARYAFSVLPAGMRRVVARLARRGGGAPSVLRRLAARLDRAIAPSRAALDWIQRERPDAVVVLPEANLVSAFDSAESQADLIRAAMAFGVPTIAVAVSGDAQLQATMLQPRPSHALVWNESLTRPAAGVVREDRVLVTGAALFDRGLDEPPVVDGAEFRQMMGLPSERPFAVYVGSPGPFIDADAEIALVRDWAKRLRRLDDSVLRQLPVLVRPAPSRASRWQSVDLSDLDNIVVRPHSYDRAGELNMVLLAESIRYAAVTVGSDGHALTLAAALGRPAVAVTGADGSGPSSNGHPFAFLWSGEAATVRRAATAEELTTQVREAIDRGGGSARCYTAFVRPIAGRSPSQIAAECIESIARLGGRRARPWLSPARWVMRVPLLLGAAGIALLASFERSR